MTHKIADGTVKITHTTQTATASCAHCDWTCKMTGIRVVEMGVAIREALVDHVLACHPDEGGKVPS